MKKATELIAQRKQAEEDFCWIDGFEGRNMGAKPDKKRQKLMERSRKNRERLDNPYGVPIGLGNWAGVNMVLNFGITINYAHLPKNFVSR